jgi:hypothetical protein
MWIQRKKNVMEGLSIIADGMDKPLKTLIVSPMYHINRHSRVDLLQPCSSAT